MAINIDLVADVKGVIKGTDRISDALDDVADDLKDLGKDGDKLEDKVSSAFKGMADNARKAGKDIGREVKDGTEKAGDGLKDMRDESVSTARESAASFGSIEDAADSLQEILANAFAGFGPAGAAAGLAAAVGIGLAISAAQEAAETNNAAKEKAVEMIDAIAEAGGHLVDLDVSERIKSWGREVLEDNWMTFWANEASTKFQETAKDAETYGVSSRDAIRAAAGSAADSRKFLDATADSWQELNRKVEEGQTVTESGLVTFSDSARAAMDQRNALSDLRGQAEENIRTTEDAVEIYGLEKAAMDGTAEATERATDALQDRAAELEAAANAAMGADGAELNYIATLEQSSKDIQTNGRNVDAHTAAGRANRQTLIEMATSARTLIDAQIEQGDSTAVVAARTNDARTAFINAATAAGFTKDQAKGLADQYGLIPGNVDTHVKAHNVANTKKEIDGVAAPRTAYVTILPDGREVEAWFRGMDARTIRPNVAPRLGAAITD